MCIRTEILTVEDLRRNVLSEKICFHFHDYPLSLSLYIYMYIYIYIKRQNLFKIYQNLMCQTKM